MKLKVSQLIEQLGLKQVTKGDYDDMEAKGCFIGDLLSWVMSRAKEGDIWITVQTNINIVAIAALTGAACVIVPENIEIEQATIDKADERGVVILGSPLDSYSLAVGISKLL